MKILVAIHTVMDLGGIINHTEQLIGGLKDLGHTVQLKQLVNGAATHDQRREGDFIIGPSGIPHHQGKGWNFSRNDRLSYKGSSMAASVRQVLSGYDLIIWTIPVPSKNKDNAGNSYWAEMYDLPKKVKQVAFIHDGNARKGIPHILAIQEHLTAVACVHECALNSSDFLTVPRAMVLNPQENPVRDVVPWNDKRPGFVSMQTFKAWKHVHELVAAIAYMKPKTSSLELREIAGKGIEYQYMTSEDKCKPEYFHSSYSPFGERKIWEVALENGMIHHDYWNTEEVVLHLRNARVLVDPSWSNNYSKNGGHWNRVVVDAMIHGCVPIATQLGMGDTLFQDYVHYVPAHHGGESPELYADIIEETSNMSLSLYRTFREGALEILPLFDRKAVAQRLLDLVNGDLDSTEVKIGKEDRYVRQSAENICFNHFGMII